MCLRIEWNCVVIDRPFFTPVVAATRLKHSVIQNLNFTIKIRNMSNFGSIGYFYTILNNSSKIKVFMKFYRNKIKCIFLHAWNKGVLQRNYFVKIISCSFCSLKNSSAHKTLKYDLMMIFKPSIRFI